MQHISINRKMLIFQWIIFFLFFLTDHGYTKSNSGDSNTIKFDVLSYELSIKIAFEHKEWWMAFQNKLLGESKITLRNNSNEPISEIPIVLNRLMRITGIKVNQEIISSFNQELAELQNWENYQVRSTVIPLVRSLQPQELLTIEIQYQGPLTGYTESGMAYVREKLDAKFTIIRPETLSYPILAYPTESDVRHFWRESDFFDHILKVTVPQNYVAASGYELISKKKIGEFVQWNYKSVTPAYQIIIPIAPYGIIDIGKHRIFYFQEDKEGAERISKSVKNVLSLYSTWFGPLKDTTSMAIIEIPEGYGSQALRPTIIQTQPAFTNPNSVGQLYHEISHFWNVPDPEPNAMRWNEGLAMFLQYLTVDELDGADQLMENLEKRRLSLKSYFEDNPEHRNITFRDYGKKGIASPVSYDTGAIFFGILFEKLGKEKFVLLMGDYYQQYFDQGAPPDVFANFIISKAKSTDRIFKDWFFTTKYVELVSNLTFKEIVGKY